jgi:hypothetical protein
MLGTYDKGGFCICNPVKSVGTGVDTYCLQFMSVCRDYLLRYLYGWA